MKDRMDEMMGEKKMVMKKKKSKMAEAKAGRDYNKSAKHKKAESVGMKRAMRGK